MTHADDYDELREIMQILAAANFRDLASNCQQQRMQTALWLHRSGIAAVSLRALWRYAQRRGIRSPEGLFASSFDKPSTLDKRLRAAAQWSRAQIVEQTTDDIPKNGTEAPIYRLNSRKRNA